MIRKSASNSAFSSSAGKCSPMRSNHACNADELVSVSESDVCGDPAERITTGVTPWSFQSLLATDHATRAPMLWPNRKSRRAFDRASSTAICPDTS
ncbi:hypothetical protein EMIT0158MI4_20124 [Burkholderia ambifaria]